MTIAPTVATSRVVQVAADPLGGWVVAEQRAIQQGGDVQTYVRAFSLAANGRLSGPVDDLGLGSFVADGDRPTHSFAVDRSGRALLVFLRESVGPDGSGEPPTAILAQRQHGARFQSLPLSPAGRFADPSVAVGAGPGLIAAIRVAHCVDLGNGCSGSPVVSAIGSDGTAGPLFGPAPAASELAFDPWAAGLGSGAAVLLFQRAHTAGVLPRAAPVEAVTVRPDGMVEATQILTSAAATEPMLLPLPGPRALALWAEHDRLGAALAGADGRFHTTAAPRGPAPIRDHASPANRDAHAAGRWAIVSWTRSGRVRVSLRRF